MTDLRKMIGLGVAGNFAGHLEQAGEASDFVAVAVEDAEAPKGLFPFYVPGVGEHFLGRFPISAEEIRRPGPDRYDAKTLRELVVREDAEQAEGASILRQVVV